MDGIYYGVTDNHRQLMFALVEVFNPVTGQPETVRISPWELTKDSLKQYRLISSEKEHLEHLTDALDSGNLELARSISAHLAKGRVS